ncbi:MAG: methionyl-tRNA formyltransferase [Magnetococcales bacterium]|nr:methionyl-tRNA formyltransferase [Magnetococcales bacterium]MBF0113689.1 methionyl-tRNA formyltransferase [Magnetococcales bacterium]
MSTAAAPWRIVFMGTPTFAVPVLSGLLQGEDAVVGVFTQPDKPVGRGLQLTASPVKQLAEQRGVAVFQPTRLRTPEAVQTLRALQPDLVVVVAYGQILAPEVLALPRWGCLNIHASLLPRWRGAAPIQRAILAGDSATGVTLMRMDAGLDTGPMLCWRTLPITATLTGGQLHDQLSVLGAELLRDALPRLKAGALPLLPQPEEGVTYAAKLQTADEQIDWQRPAAEIERQIRALNPWPAAQTSYNGKPLKLFACRLGAHNGAPGRILQSHADAVEVACGVGSLLLTELQPAGKRRMSCADWWRGLSVRPEQFG